VSESTIGLGRARNAGWRAARGALLAFVDDDCYLTETYIDDLLEVFRANPDVGFVAGRTSLFDSGDLALTFDDCARAREYEPYRFVPAGSLHGANLTFRREVLGLIGGFNPLLGRGRRSRRERTSKRSRERSGGACVASTTRGRVSFTTINVGLVATVGPSCGATTSVIRDKRAPARLR
jgi:glycosyltransferase involved in cell wall biosynthesis